MDFAVLRRSLCQEEFIFCEPPRNSTYEAVGEVDLTAKPANLTLDVPVKDCVCFFSVLSKSSTAYRLASKLVSHIRVIVHHQAVNMKIVLTVILVLTSFSAALSLPEESKVAAKNVRGSNANQHRNLAPAGIAYPTTRYTPYSELSSSAIVAANTLTLSRTQWNNPFSQGSIEYEKDWIQLTPAQQTAASGIDCGTEDCWDCYIHHYNDYNWTELGLEPNVREAFIDLGWTEARWIADDFPPSEELDWVQLSDTQRAAADVLCYFEDTWDGDPLETDVCFSGHALVEVQGKGTTRMDELRIGDAVMTSQGFSKVFSFGHYAPGEKTKFLQIQTASMDPKYPLEISEDHLISTKGTTTKKFVPAGTLKIGDYLMTEKGPSVIESIREVHRKGSFSPLTANGELLVNGATASSYVSRQWLKTKVSGDALHYFQHGGVLSYQLYCAFSDCSEEAYNEETGFSAWVQFWYEVEQWQLHLGAISRVVFLFFLALGAIPIILLGGLFALPTNSMVIHLVAACIGYCVWKQWNRKKVGKDKMPLKAMNVK